MDDLRKLENKMRKDGEPTLFPVSRAVYAEQVEEENAGKRGMKSMADLMAARASKPKERKTERGELLKYFNKHVLNKKGKPYGIPFFGRQLQGIPTQDLYYLKSVCEQESKRTFTDKKTGQVVQITVGMIFWREIKPK